jgi:TRAP-type C4-dicarboxylate transport system substrate-binding protein
VGYQIEVWAESEKESLRAVEEAGVEIIRPQKTVFSEMVEPLYEAYRDDSVKYDLIQSIKNYGIEK